MLLTLHRYVLRELLRTFLLTAAVLVTVIAFGAAIKPLASDELLSAGQVAKYIVLAAVPMLEFALPFAAGFAATVTFHRLSTDNEILAASASGIAYRRLLVPAFWMGGALLLIMIVLTQWTIPRFWKLMQATIAVDVTRVFERAIGRGEPFQIGRLQVYAADMAVQENPPGTNADVRMVLLRGAAAELDDDGRAVTDVTFSQAVADLYRESGRTIIKLAMRDTVAYSRRASRLMAGDEVRPDKPFEVGQVMEDRPAFMSINELLALGRDPDAYGRVRRARDELATALGDAAIFDAIDRRLRDVGEVAFIQEGPEEVRYLVRAGGLGAGRFTASGDGSLEVLELVAGEPVRGYRPAAIEIEPSPSPIFQSTALDLLLREPQVSDLRSGVSNPRAEVPLTGLLPDVSGTDGFEGWASDRLLAHVAELEPAPPAVRERSGRLRSAIVRLREEIRARIWERHAICVTAPLLLLLGACLAMWRREGLPLTIYLWAFLPSVADLIIISGGAQMLRDGRSAGWIVLWSGNALLAGFLLFVFLKVRRH